MSAEPEASAACCEQSDDDSQKPCALCERPTCRHCRCQVNQHETCRACHDAVRAELAAEQAGTGPLVQGIVGGVLGALWGGIAWAVIAVFSGYAIGYVAIGVGWLAGQGVRLAVGRRRGQSLQVVAVASSVLGLLVGKYFIAVHYLIQGVGREHSYLDPNLVPVFLENLSQFLSPFDALWVFFAVSIAWRMLAPSRVYLGGA